MFVERNYKECVKLALQINEKRRDELCSDTLNKNTIIYRGMYASRSPATRSLRFEQYLVLWFDKHWNDLLSILNESDLHSDEKRDVQMFYANFMLEKMLPQYRSGSNYSALVYPGYFRLKEEALRKLIDFAGKQDEKINSLELSVEEHEEFYQRKLDEIEKQHNVGG